MVNQRRFSDILVGDCASVTQVVDTEMIDRFAEISGDYSPIHIQRETAQQRGFQDRVIHGLLISSLVSRVLGMLLPGEYGLLHEIHFKYKHPAYPGDTLTVKITVDDKHEVFRLLKLSIKVTNQENVVVCVGKAQSLLSE